MSTTTKYWTHRLGTEGAWFLHPAPGPGGLAALLGLFGIRVPEPPSVEGVNVTTRRVRSGSSLYHEGALAEAVYFVVAGTFKSLHVGLDGYEQVLGFSGRAELLGYDAVYSGVHPTAAIALEDSTVLALSLPDLSALCRSVPAFERALQRELSRQLAQRMAIASLMAAVSAEARLARFLVQWSDRMAECGQSARRLRLRMSRRDIASHIGVAHETVSRSFSALVQWGCLAVCNREVEILDPERLRACASSTRGLVELAAAQAVPAPPQVAGVSRCAA